MTKNRFKNIIMWVFIVLVILLAVLNIYLTIKVNEEQDARIDYQVKVMQQMINSQVKPINGIDGKDGYTPIKGIDYTDGANGKNGTDGKNGSNGIDGTNGKDGINGLTPIIHCNTDFNWWEVRYSQTDTWQVLGDEPVKCTI